MTFAPLLAPLCILKQVCTRMMSTLLECRLQEALATEVVSMLPLQNYFEKVSGFMVLGDIFRYSAHPQ